MYKAKNGLPVVIVEDDKSLAQLYAFYLNKYGHDVYVTDNGKEAIELARGDCVLLVDFNMPKMNGDEVVETIRERYGNAPRIVGMSANEDNLRQFMSKGANAAVDKKNVTMKLLDDLIRAA